jgi:PIN domain nuclease of toxin-antitoxin system
VRLLLDTNALLWLLAGHHRLGTTTRQRIESASEPLVSVVSLWEISIKASLGKLDTGTDLRRALWARGFRRLGIADEHLSVLETLPRHHRDPFDRLLISQAISEKATVVTSNHMFAAYPVDVLEASR